MIGTTLAHYRITGELGAGGMGEVWRAEDTKLGREVALKVLPEEFAADPQRLERFEREAKVLASLNHPNIAHLYGLETVESGMGTGTDSSPEPRASSPVTFLVMELVEGEDLSERVARGPVPVEEATAIALQIAEALEAAHEQGIVHRDLKPANIKLTRDGAVKVLDFGLAKTWEPDHGDSSLSLSPTMTAHATAAGVILGTAAYMSPEQARGQPVDRRADIWSFGVVLWEMLTGRKLFEGETLTDVMAALVRQEIDFDELPADTPADLRRLVVRCLNRDSRVRLRDIGEARITLDPTVRKPLDVDAPRVEAVRPSGSALARVRAAAPWLIGGAVLGAVIAFWVGGQGQRASQTASLNYSIHPEGAAVVGAEDSNRIDLSRDGTKIVFDGPGPEGLETALYLKTDVDAEPRLIPGTGGAYGPFFSPDGDWVGYFSFDGLFKISLQGGTPVFVADARDPRGAVWNSDGFIYYTPNSITPLMKVAAAGGDVSPVTTLDDDRQERTHRWPSVVPGGKAILFTSDTQQSTEYYDDARIEAVDLATGKRTVVLEGSSRALATSNGHLLFARDGSLLEAGFDLEKLEVTGNPRVVLQGILTVVASGAAQFAVSDTGSLAYVPGGKTSELAELVWIDPEGDVEKASSEPGLFIQAALSPLGDQVALVNPTRDTQDLWLLDLTNQSRSRLTFDGSNSDPTWTPDGTHIIYASDHDGTHIKPYRRSVDGIGEPVLLWDAPDEAFPMSVSRDGRWLAVEFNRFQNDDRQETEIWIVDLTGEIEPYPFFEDQIGCRFASFSPDGRWLAYVSRETGTDQVFVRPFPSADGKWQISSETAREPRWSPDGRRLIYRSLSGLQYVNVETGRGFRTGPATVFQPGSIGPAYNFRFSFSPDGERLLMLNPFVDDRDRWRIHVLLGWQEGLAAE